MPSLVICPPTLVGHWCVASHAITHAGRCTGTTRLLSSAPRSSRCGMWARAARRCAVCSPSTMSSSHHTTWPARMSVIALRGSRVQGTTDRVAPSHALQLLRAGRGPRDQERPDQGVAGHQAAAVNAPSNPLWLAVIIDAIAVDPQSQARRCRTTCWICGICLTF